MTTRKKEIFVSTSFHMVALLDLLVAMGLLLPSNLDFGHRNMGVLSDQHFWGIQVIRAVIGHFRTQLRVKIGN